MFRGVEEVFAGKPFWAIHPAAVMLRAVAVTSGARAALMMMLRCHITACTI